MGAFVLGILVGWLAEWLFFTFWVKGGKNSDCSSIMAELEERKKEINRLQSRLNDAASSKASSATATSTTSAKTESATAEKSTVATTASSTTKTADKAAAPKKAAPKKAAPKKTTAKAAPKKAPAKKAVPKKTAEKSTAKAKPGGDDFTKLSGIGPSMAATLKSLGVDTFTKLAETDDDILRDMLEASGARLNNNKEAMDSWNEQATLAAKGDFEGLKKLQEALNK